MPSKTIPGNKELANRIRQRRLELKLTIEEAAARAGISIATWNRYEAGASIRMDKCKGLCKALNWRDIDIDADTYASHSSSSPVSYEAWSPYLAQKFGEIAAASFAVGSETLLGYINDDLSDLSSKPAGTHLGQLETSFIVDELPPQFLTQYDYSFLYQMKCILLDLRRRAKNESPFLAHSVLEELIIYLCSKAALPVTKTNSKIHNNRTTYSSEAENWVFDLFGDEDIISYLYSDTFLEEDDSFHFNHWNDQVFYTADTSDPHAD